MRSVSLTGFVGRDPHFSDEKKTPVAFLSLCAKHGTEEDMWFNVTCFGFLAEFANQYIKSGRQLAISGYIKGVSTYKENVTVDIVATTIDFINTGNGEEEEGKGKGKSSGKKANYNKSKSSKSFDKSKKKSKPAPEPDDDGGEGDDGDDSDDWDDE